MLHYFASRVCRKIINKNKNGEFKFSPKVFDLVWNAPYGPNIRLSLYSDYFLLNRSIFIGLQNKITFLPYV